MASHVPKEIVFHITSTDQPLTPESSATLRVYTPDDETLIATELSLALTAEHINMCTDTDQAREDANSLQQIGEALHNTLFPPMVKELWKKWLPDDNAVQVRLRLIIEPLSEWQQLPWETMYVTPNIDERIMLVRTLLPRHQTLHDLAVEGALRVLFVGASPDDPTLETIDVRAIKEELEARLDVDTDGKSERIIFEALVSGDDTTQAPTQAMLTSKLLEDYHVLCVVAHGGHHRGQPVIYLESSFEGDTHKDFLVASDLRLMLEDKPTRLVILLACRTAESPTMVEVDERAARNFAEHLLKNDTVPAVLAMQRRVDALSIAEFCNHFVDTLANLRPIDVALAETRRHLRDQHTSLATLTAPVLYLQSDNSNLFHPLPNWRRYVQYLIALIIVTIIASVIAIFITDQNRRDALIQAEGSAREQLQSFAQQNNIRRYTPGANPSAPLVLGDSVWVTTTQRDDTPSTVWRYSMRADTPPQRYTVGRLPGTLVSDGQYLWLTDSRDGTLWRIDPQSEVPDAPIMVGSRPTIPVSTSRWTIVASGVENTLTIVDAATLANRTVDIPFNALPAFIADDVAWLYSGMQYWRLDLPTGNVQSVDVPPDAERLVQGTSYLWAAGDRQIYQFTPQTGTLVDSLPLGDTTLTALQFIDGALWGRDANAARLHRIDLAAGTIEQSYQMPNDDSNISDYTVVGNRLVAVVDGATIVTWNVDNSTVLASTPTLGANRINAMVTDGDHLWLHIPAEDRLTGLSLATGEFYRELSPCPQLSAPSFDGSHLWVSCPTREEVQRVPVLLHYFGIQISTENTSPHPPQFFDGDLWQLQPDSGRLIAYDPVNHVETLRLSLAGVLKPLIVTDDYLWTWDEQQGIIWRIQSWRNVLSQQREANIEQLTLAGDIFTMEVINDTLWVSHSNLLEGSGDNAPSLTIINQHTLATTPAEGMRQIVSGITPDVGAGIVWLSNSDWSKPMLSQLDAQTGALQHDIELPQDDLALWQGVPIEDKWWFTASAPTLATTLRRFGITVDPDEIFDVEDSRVYQFDPATRTWERNYAIPQLVAQPSVDGRYLWFSTFDVIPTVVKETEDTGASLIVLDTTDGSTAGPYTLCDSVSPIHVTEYIVLAGCFAPAADVWIMNRQSRQWVQQYSQLGSRPWEPLRVGDELWVVFRESDNLAILDAQTGAIKRIRSLGDAPQPPIYFNGYVWIYNTGDGTLQRFVAYNNGESN